MQTGQFRSAPDAVRLIVGKEGFRGLYAGYGSFLLRDLPFDAIQFCIYEQLRIGYKVVVPILASVLMRTIFYFWLAILTRPQTTSI
jgi:hypothetical protein